MGEHILKIALAELTTVRITCKTCSLTAEAPLDRLDALKPECPFCQSPFYLTPMEIAQRKFRLSAFKEAAERLMEMSTKHFEVSFPINLDAHKTETDGE